MEIRRVKRPLTEEQKKRHAQIRAEFEAEKPALNRGAAERKRELLEIAEAMRALKRERENRGLTLSEVAQRAGIDKSNLSKLENDPQPNPTLDTLSRIAHAIGVRLTIGVVSV